MIGNSADNIYLYWLKGWRHYCCYAYLLLDFFVSLLYLKYNIYDSFIIISGSCLE